MTHRSVLHLVEYRAGDAAVSTVSEAGRPTWAVATDGKVYSIDEGRRRGAAAIEAALINAPFRCGQHWVASTCAILHVSDPVCRWLRGVASTLFVPRGIGHDPGLASEYARYTQLYCQKT